MPIFQTLREMHPYRLLLIAVLATVVLAQVVAMVMVTRSQVDKAQAFYAQEQAHTARTAQNSVDAAPTPPQTAPGGVMHVGFAVTR